VVRREYESLAGRQVLRALGPQAKQPV